MLWYQYALVAICAFAWGQGYEPLRRAAAVMLVNTAVLSAWYAITGNNDNVMLNAAIDAISAFVIISHPAGREQGWLAMTFAFQLGVDISALMLDIRGIGIPNIQPSYWQLLHYAFIIQLFILAGWSEAHGGQIGGVLHRLIGHFRHRVARAQVDL